MGGIVSAYGRKKRPANADSSGRCTEETSLRDASAALMKDVELSKKRNSSSSTATKRTPSGEGRSSKEWERANGGGSIDDSARSMRSFDGDADEEQRIAMKEKRKNQKKIPHRSTSLPPLSALQPTRLPSPRPRRCNHHHHQQQQHGCDAHRLHCEARRDGTSKHRPHRHAAGDGASAHRSASLPPLSVLRKEIKPRFLRAMTGHELNFPELIGRPADLDYDLSQTKFFRESLGENEKDHMDFFRDNAVENFVSASNSPTGSPRSAESTEQAMNIAGSNPGQMEAPVMAVAVGGSR